MSARHPHGPVQCFSICKTQNPCPWKHGKKAPQFPLHQCHGQILWWFSKARIPESLVFLIKSQFRPLPNYFHLGLMSLRCLTLSRELKQIGHSSYKVKARRKSGTFYFKSQKQGTFLGEKSGSFFFLSQTEIKFLNYLAFTDKILYGQRPWRQLYVWLKCFSEYEKQGNVHFCELILQPTFLPFLSLINIMRIFKNIIEKH